MKKPILISNKNLFVDSMKRGDVVAFPTDTVWGIGASLNYEKSMERIFEIKKDRLIKFCLL